MADSDNAALRLLYQENHNWLLGWFRRRLRNSDHAADYAQDTFLKVLLAPTDQLLREPRAYLATIGRQLIVDQHRRYTLEQAYLNAMALAPMELAPSPEERAIVLETLQRIDAMLDGLPSNVRQALLLSQLDGLTYSEIAARLGVSERTVKRYMAEAFEQCMCVAHEQQQAST